MPGVRSIGREPCRSFAGHTPASHQFRVELRPVIAASPARSVPGGTPESISSESGEGAMNSHSYSLIEQAMRLSWALLPVGPDKRPLVKSWKEFQLTRASQVQVESWVQGHPPAWAIITGAVSGVIVLDFRSEEHT